MDKTIFKLINKANINQNGGGGKQKMVSNKNYDVIANKILDYYKKFFKSNNTKIYVYGKVDNNIFKIQYILFIYNIKPNTTQVDIDIFTSDKKENNSYKKEEKTNEKKNEFLKTTIDMSKFEDCDLYIYIQNNNKLEYIIIDINDTYIYTWDHTNNNHHTIEKINFNLSIKTITIELLLYIGQSLIKSGICDTCSIFIEKKNINCNELDTDTDIDLFNNKKVVKLHSDLSYTSDKIFGQCILFNDLLIFAISRIKLSDSSICLRNCRLSKNQREIQNYMKLLSISDPDRQYNPTLQLFYLNIDKYNQHLQQVTTDKYSYTYDFIVSPDNYLCTIIDNSPRFLTFNKVDKKSKNNKHTLEKNNLISIHNVNNKKEQHFELNDDNSKIILKANDTENSFTLDVSTIILNTSNMLPIGSLTILDLFI